MDTIEYLQMSNKTITPTLIMTSAKEEIVQMGQGRAEQISVLVQIPGRLILICDDSHRIN